MPDADRFGTDLRLVVDTLHQHGRGRGSDLQTVEHSADRVDLATVSGVDNLAHALLLRFLTPLGELSALGHPTYGSRLYELIGELNTPATRNRAKVFALQALAEEPRIARTLSLSVTATARDTITVSAQLQAVDADTPFDLVFPLFLAGGVG
jgi:phage baseplate assembly protein W